MDAIKKTLPSILIVEDDLQLCDALSHKFEHENFSVLTASDGEKGIKVALDKLPDIILLDILMPVIDGITMLNILRETEWGKNVPIFMLTNKADSGMISAALESRANRYLIKADTSLDSIVKEVKETLNIA